jgi:hypothetical protein
MRSAADRGTARNSHLGPYHGPFSDFHIVSDLNQVINTCGASYTRAPERRPVNGYIRTDPHIVFNLDGSRLRDLMIEAGGARKSEPITSDNGTAVNGHIISDSDSFPNRHVREYDCSAAYLDHGSMNLCPVSDFDPLTDCRGGVNKTFIKFDARRGLEFFACQRR